MFSAHFLAIFQSDVFVVDFMKKLVFKGFLLFAYGSICSIAAAQMAETATHCTSNERTLFSCATKKNKIVSICASKDLSPNSGYMQYRFGKDGKVEMEVPQAAKGLPDFSLTASKDGHAEYNDISFFKGAFVYSLTSFRQITAKNKDGYPTPPSSDSLSVRDTRKSMREGDIVFSDDCASLVTPLNATTISKLTGKKLEKAGF